MGKRVTAFYSPTDDMEHAVVPIYPPHIPNNAILDYTFSPATQGKLFFTGPLTYSPVVTAISGLYSPLDELRYCFFTTAENLLCGTWYTGSNNDPLDPRLLPNGYIVIQSLPEGVADIDAFFSLADNKMHIEILMESGNVYEAIGTPWTNNTWSVAPYLLASGGYIPPFTSLRVQEGRSICAYSSSLDGTSQLMIATTTDVIAVDHSIRTVGDLKRTVGSLRTLAHFDNAITSISGFFTPDDGLHHVVVATGAQVNEIVFSPGFHNLTVRMLGTVNFPLIDIGAYVKPDSGRHVIMIATDYQLYLSWYYPGWSEFVFAPWPPILAP